MLTSPTVIPRQLRFASRHGQLPQVARRLASEEFEEFDDLAGDVAEVAGRIERDGMIALDYAMFGAD